MNRKVLFLCLCPLMFLLVLAASPRAATQENAPAIRKIPGINAPDPYASACTSCHINKPATNQDGRLSTSLKRMSTQGATPRILAKAQAAAPKGMKLTGKHPPVPVTTVPGGCLVCHGKNSKIAPPMSQMIHLIHLSGEDNNFVKNYGGECTHCHKLNPTTGAWGLPNGPEK